MNAFLFISGVTLFGYLLIEFLLYWSRKRDRDKSYKTGKKSCTECSHIVPVAYWLFTGGHTVGCPADSPYACTDDYCAKGKVRGNTYYTLCRNKNRRQKCKEWKRGSN